MCGICGFINPSFSDAGVVLETMTEAIRHRGPDDHGYLSVNRAPGHSESAVRRLNHSVKNADIYLGHRRLSIIDLTQGHQPMSFDEGSLWITYNGEIYNYREIRQELETRNYKFHSDSDTEVLLAAYAEWGQECVNHFRGMFAFCIVDRKEQKLFLARDHFGQKPLFFHKNGHCFAFASELQSLRQLPGFPRDKFNVQAFGHYFRYGFIPSPNTAFKDVYSLKPGHTLTVEFGSGNYEVRQYWKPSVTADLIIKEEELTAKFDESVKLHLRADVPVGVFLSGGIDSSLIASSAINEVPSGLKSFTISTGDTWCDESQEAKQIADHLGTDHLCHTVEPDFINVIEKLVTHYGQPFADFSCVPTYYVSAVAQQKVKVALSGDGGDEIFAGYKRYLNYHFTDIISMIPWAIRKIISSALKSRSYNRLWSDYFLSANKLPAKGENHASRFHNWRRHSCYTDLFASELKSQQQEESDHFIYLYNNTTATDPVAKWLEVDQQMSLSDNMLVKVDIAAMATSLETRAPFLDPDFATLANRISLNQKLNNGVTKSILRNIADKRLPKGISGLPKKGFTMPLKDWMRTDLRDWCYAALFDNPDYWSPYIRSDSVREMWRKHQQGTLNNSSRLWQLIALCLFRKSL